MEDSLKISRNVLFFCLICLCAWLSYHYVYERALHNQLVTSNERAGLYKSTLQSTLKRLSHIPQTVAIHPHIIQVLNGERSAENFSEQLSRINDFSDAAALYVMDKNGTTIASSNFMSDESFVGKNYGFRQYFKTAITGKIGEIFAVGATTGRSGYFIASPVRERQKIIGVVVVKVEFAKLISDWQNSGEKVLVSDKLGVVILSSQKNWIYKTLIPISEIGLANIQSSRKYGHHNLTLLDFKSNSGAFANEISLNNNDYFVSETKIPELSWKLFYLAPLQPIQRTALFVGLACALLIGMGGLAFQYFQIRQNQKILQLEAAEANRIKLVNKRLLKEISVRKKTEKQLREMQDEVVLASRLTALGKMSAAIVHEVNQPVSAIRNFAASGLLLLKQNRKKELNETLNQIKTMTVRLGGITSELLVFSRKPIANRKKVDLNFCVEVVANQYKLEMESKQIAYAVNMQKQPLMVSGSQIRFEQLISNLIKNAIQACEATDCDNSIIVETKSDKANAIISVSDSGKGLTKGVKAQMFDPFYTTKPAGKGVGLGLALCFAIADEAGGKITVKNMKKAGAKFTVTIPLASSSKKNH